LERPSIRIRFVRLAKAGREIKNCFAGISLQPATPDECRLITSDMHNRNDRDDFVLEDETPGRTSSSATHSSRIWPSFWHRHNILVGLGHDSERGAIGRRVRPKPRSVEFHGAARLAWLPDSYGSAAGNTAIAVVAKDQQVIEHEC
jgi:hypothetical protein